MSESTTRMAEIEDRAETIAAAFAESDEDALAAVDVDTLVEYFTQLLAYDVPLDEAERSVVRRVLDETDMAPEDLPEEVAALGGFSTAPSGFDRTLVGEVAQADEWVDVRVEVVELWEPYNESIAQVGLLGDESGTIKFVKWDSAALPRLEEGESYRIESAVTDEYEGRYSITLNSATEISNAEEAVSGTAELVGAIVDIQPGSGLIKRCPTEECTRVLQNGRCSEHGKVDGEFDLRIKAVFDDGQTAVNALFDQEATEALTGLSLAAAKEMAMDALDTSVVREAIEDEVVGQFYRLEGPVIGEYVLVESPYRLAPAEALDGPGIDPSTVGRAASSRQPARRVLAREFNSTTETFKESDEERAPVFALLPTGEAVNRVVAAGTLTETADVGSDGEYWQGRVVDPSGTFFVYAGQYQPEVATQLRQLEPPAYVAVVGKPRTYETDEGDTHVSVRPEALQVIDTPTRDRWVREAVAHTRARLAAFEAGDSPYAERAREVYGEDVSGIEEAVDKAERNLEGDDDDQSADEKAEDDEHPCPDCEASFESEHGLATHRGQKHADVEAD